MTSHQQQLSLYAAKLLHYNTWLLDPKRPAGKPYPGFPQQRELDSMTSPRLSVAPAARNTVKPAAKPATKAKAVRSRSGPTKLDQARALYKENIKLSRVNMIDLFREKLQMSKAGATTYYYNVQK